MDRSVLDQVVLHNFPLEGISMAFGYGSRVVKQLGTLSGKDLVDIIFVVDNSRLWHSENLSRNGHHYSALRYLSNNADLIRKFQENFGARIYFNPYVDVANISMKYGVIKTEHLIEDLNTWNNLYVAGRLHKPVELLVNLCDRNDKLRSALRFNKESAIRAALLQLPESFDPIHLYKLITGLSYHGDFRMLFGEDKNKIDNIVSKQMDRFDQLYLPLMKMSPSFKDCVHWHDAKRTLTQDLSDRTIYRHLSLLSKNLKRKLCEIHGKDARSAECEVVLSSLSKNLECDKIVASAIATIVRRSSLTQSFKGLITAGLAKSLRYSHRKIIKSLLSRTNSLN